MVTTFRDALSNQNVLWHVFVFNECSRLQSSSSGNTLNNTAAEIHTISSSIRNLHNRKFMQSMSVLCLHDLSLQVVPPIQLLVLMLPSSNPVIRKCQQQDKLSLLIGTVSTLHREGTLHLCNEYLVVVWSVINKTNKRRVNCDHHYRITARVMHTWTSFFFSLLIYKQTDAFIASTILCNVKTVTQLPQKTAITGRRAHPAY